MLLKNLPNGEIAQAERKFNDHYVFSSLISSSYSWSDRLPAPGILAFLRGSGSLTINDQHLTLDERSFLVMNRGSVLTLKISKSGSRPVLLFFNADLAAFLSRTLLKKIREESTGILHDFTLVEHIHYKNATLANHLELLIDLGDSCASFHALKADMIIRSILDDLINENYNAMRIAEIIQVVKQSTRVNLYKRLATAKDWMENNYASADLGVAADIAMLNTQHFLRHFKQAFGTTPHQYLTDIRINKAGELLEATDLPVTAICQQVGFESLASFSTLFKKRFGASPSFYRKSPSLAFDRGNKKSHSRFSPHLT